MSTSASPRQAKDALYDAFAQIAAALSSGRRAEIIEILSQGERTVEQIAGEIGQTLANTSHHLRTLARAGLVASRRDGIHIHYRLASPDVLDAWWAMRRLAETQLADFDEIARAYLGDRDDLDTISRDALGTRMAQEDVVIIDVRPEPEYAAGHLPGAISIPPDRLPQLLDDLPPGDVIAYCRGPYCRYADDAVRHLRLRGRQATRLEDGLPEWHHAGGPIERS